jgi:hypothetical protein
VSWSYLSAPALAVGRTGDATATRAYISASESYARSASAVAAAGVAAIEARASEIATECPLSLTYAPRDAEFGELGETASETLVYAGLVPMRPAALRLAGAIAHLSWSSSKLTRLVRSLAAVERSGATFELPNVCAEIAGWKASAYATPPPGVAGFLARVYTSEERFGAAEESRESYILSLLKPFESASQRRAVKRAERIEALTWKRLNPAIAAAERKLAAALGASAL